MTPIDALHGIFDRQRRAATADGPSFAVRRRQLAELDEALRRHRSRLIAAMDADFGHRAAAESLLGDLLIVHEEIKYIGRHLKRWMRPRRAHVDWKFRPGRAFVLIQPRGVVGIISPWNYPVNLALAPLAAALAAGNRVMLKPSEFTPHTSAALAAMLSEICSPDLVAVIEGGAEIAAAFAALPFDHLLFTGSTAIGRKVMAAAAENLTPVTLELGGKSPAIVDRDADLERSARSLVAGKLFNAGQTCIAPDYVLLVGPRRAAFSAALQRAAGEAYPDFASNADYTSIIDQRQYGRLQQWLAEATAGGATVVPLVAGEDDPAARRMVPRLLFDMPAGSALEREEIFGPLLPVVEVADAAGAIDYIQNRARPLALYYFGKANEDEVLRRTISGGVCVNDTLLHIAQSDLPFGGIGPSGMGEYHGEEGFMTFSKKKAVFRQSRLNAAGLLRPPYKPWKERLLAWLAK